MWKLIVGNPWLSVAAGVAFLFVIAGAFGYGYYTATGQYEAALLNQQQAIATAVHEKDAALLDAAVKAGQLVEARRGQSAQVITGVLAAIKNLPNPVTQACEITPEALHLLNEAGRK